VKATMMEFFDEREVGKRECDEREFWKHECEVEFDLPHMSVSYTDWHNRVVTYHSVKVVSESQWTLECPAVGGSASLHRSTIAEDSGCLVGRYADDNYRGTWIIKFLIP